MSLILTRYIRYNVWLTIRKKSLSSVSKSEINRKKKNKELQSSCQPLFTKIKQTLKMKTFISICYSYFFFNNYITFTCELKEHALFNAVRLQTLTRKRNSIG